MKIKQITRESLFLLFLIYYAQDWLYTSGSILSQACIVIIILVSGLYFIKTLLLKEKNNLFYNAWTLFLLLNILGFILKPDFYSGPTRDMFKNILGCMLPFYPFYYFARKGELKASNFIRFFLLMLPVVLFRFFANKNQILLERNALNTDVVNNLSYTIVCLLPYVFLIKKKLISGALITVLILFIIQGAKRGAFIAGFIGLLMYFYYQLKTIDKNTRIYGYLIALIYIGLISAFAYKMSINNEFLVNRMTSILQGNTSNRDLIYTAIFEEWYNSANIWNLLFGFGFAASLYIVGGFAHNDWLEILSNFGLIGIFLYLFLFYSAVKQSMNINWQIDKRILMITIVMIWFFESLVSMWYAGLATFTQSILIGYLVGSERRNLE
jgi:hypothetical protein